MHSASCFVTLTYSDETVPLDGSLCKRDVTLFMKRLRKKTGKRLRYMLVGEYGDQTHRPHYHLLLYGEDFKADRQLWRDGKNPLYTSKLLEETWGKGYAPIGELTFDSAAYVARYAMKKINGKRKTEHYRRRTADCTWDLTPEFSVMSRKPGLGKAWLKKYWRDVYTDDHVIFKGRKYPPPKRYDAWMYQENPYLMFWIRARREARLEDSNDEWTLDRLAAAKKVVDRQLSEFARYL